MNPSQAQLAIDLREPPGSGQSRFDEINVWRSDDVEIDPARWLVRRGATSVQLTHKELGLLRILIQADGAAVPRSLLWDSYSTVTPNSSRSLDAHVWSLRKKLERDPANPKHLVTLPGYGYKLV